MRVKQLCLIAIMASIQQFVFFGFSNILYVEFITFVTLVFAMVFPRKECVMSSLIFTLGNCFMKGITPFTMMYVIIYPSYSFIISSFQNKLKNNKIAIVLLCGFFSFLTGQLLQLPFLLFHKGVTLLYLLLGLKTSLIQFVFSGIVCWLCYDRIYPILKRQKEWLQ